MEYILYLGFFMLGVIIAAVIMLVLLSKVKNIINNDFTQIASNTIKVEQEDLRKQNREILEDKLLPLSKELSEFKDRVERLNNSGIENTTKIVEQLGILERNNKLIESEAKNLTDALTKNQNIKGAYGENILNMILENSGMTEGIHYIKQYHSKAENSKDEELHDIRPDIIINLPNEKHLVIDSKVTLTSYLECTKDFSKVKEFKAEVKKRISELADKNYQKAKFLSQPDFILMYMPIDSSIALLYEDSDLIEFAYKSNIIIVGTASLLVAIRLVNQLFAKQKQNENIEQIVNAGANLYETFVLLCQELIQMQKDLDNLSKQFTTAINRFQRPNKNKPSLFSQVEELKKYGINTAKKIPENLLNYVFTNENEEISINDKSFSNR